MLSFVPTPIGNKEDITLRGLRLLEELDILFCEDTRTTIKLLRMYEIEYRNKQLLSFTSHTAPNKLEQYLELIKNNHCGVVSEAGTPWLSDPGKHLIKLCREYHLPFEVLPWANALIPTVIATPTNTTNFVYMWFPPTKKGRKTFLTKIIQSVYPVFIYESVHRIQKLLEQMEDLWYNGKVIIMRELTKMYEQIEAWTTQELLKKMENWDMPIKGEFVVWFFGDNEE